MAHEIYFFAPTAENIEKFESIQDSIEEFLYFTNQSVKIGDTNIKTNFTNPETGQPVLSTIQKAYFCTSFHPTEEQKEFMLTFDDVHCFDNQQEAENFKNGIIA